MSDRNKALLLAFVSGLLSLGMEIIWTRLVSFTHHTVPQSFASVLFCYLLGIALGAHLGKRHATAVVARRISCGVSSANR
jgi:hypothetical protein